MAEPIGIVRFVPGWPVHFESERERIAQALGDLAIRIDHTGSTALPGLGGKPTIDIQVSVERFHPLSAYGPALSELRYEHLPHLDDAVRPFFYRTAAGRRISGRLV